MSKDLLVWKKYLEGKSQVRIAAELNIAQSSVSRQLKKLRGDIPTPQQVIAAKIREDVTCECTCKEQAALIAENWIPDGKYIVAVR